MTVHVFPASLPPPCREGYEVDKDPMATEEKNDWGGYIVQPTRIASFETHSLKWILSQSEYDVFDGFCEDDLAAYSSPFIFPWDDGAGGTVAHTVIFAELPTATLTDGLAYEVSAKLMTAGAELGNFGHVINVDGTVGGTGPIYGGSGGQQPPGTLAQDPLRRINLADRVMYHLDSQPLVLAYWGSSGRFVAGPNNGQAQPMPANWEWKAETNTTASEEYVFWGTHEILEILDVDYDPPSQAYLAATPQPTMYSNMRVEDATSEEPIVMTGVYAAYAFFHYEPHFWKYIRHRQTIHIKDTISGFIASATYIIHVGSKTP